MVYSKRSNRETQKFKLDEKYRPDVAARNKRHVALDKKLGVKTARR